MFDIGGGEIIFIVFAILLLFGPKKIPEFAKMVKKGMSEVKKAQGVFQEHIIDIKEEINKPIKEVVEKVQQAEPVEKKMNYKPTDSYSEYEKKKAEVFNKEAKSNTSNSEIKNDGDNNA